MFDDSNIFDNFYNYAFINAILFTDDIKRRIKIMEENKVDKDFLLNIFYNYLIKNKDREMFDIKLKNSCYTFIDYLCNNSSDKDRVNNIAKINEMKRIINNSDDYNLGFVRAQILMRDYGSSYYSLNRIKLNHVPDNYILQLKETYYYSIVYDLNFLNIFKFDNATFNKVSGMYLLNKNFYRSLNYFILKAGCLFKNNYYRDKIRFVIEQDLNVLINRQYNENDVDEEFFDICNVTNRLIKKFNVIDTKNV